MAFRTKGPAEWTTDDVLAFLDDLSLSHADATFKENAIDGPFLMVLSADDMEKELGLKPLQIRKITAALDDAKNRGDPSLRAAGAAAGVSSDARAIDQGAAAAAVAAAPAAAPAAYPPAAPAPAPVAAPPPAPTVPPAWQQAEQLLGQAENHLTQAAGMLGKAAATQAMQTGAQMAGGRRRMTLTGVVIDSNQRKQTNNAGDLAWAAMQAIDQAKQLVPDLPAMRQPQVQAVGSPLFQGLTRGPMLDALRTGKASMSRQSVDQCRTDVHQARTFLAGRISAMQAQAAAAGGHYMAAPAAAVAAPPPAYHPPPQQQPVYQQQVYQQPPPMMAPPPAAAPPPMARPAGAPLLGAAVVGGMLGARRARRR